MEVSIDLNSLNRGQDGVGKRRTYDQTPAAGGHGHQHHGHTHYDHEPFKEEETTSSWTKIIRTILSDRDCKRVFYFLTLQSSITLLQITYGTFAGSLGLVSAAFHSVFDCLSLVISLVAMICSKQRPTNKFSYGYDRFEILSSFSNGVFLMFVSLFLLFESIERISEPEEYHGEKSAPIIFVAFLGLVVNILGVAFFYDARGKPDPLARQQARSENVYSILVHISMDAVANVGVILSTFLMSHDWLLADPVVAIGIICLIGYNALPFVTRNAQILLQTTPLQIRDLLEKSLREATTIEGVLECRNEHFWTQSHNSHVGSVIVRVGANVDEQVVLRKVHGIFDPLISDFTVQVEKDSWKPK